MKNDFIEKSRQIHKSKYDYSKVEYTNNKTKVCIICPQHGEFWQTPNNHLSGNGCPICAKEQHKDKCRKTNLNSFIEKYKEKFGDKYDFSESIYVNSKTKMKVICHNCDCEEHGIFYITPYSLISGHGCLKCYNQRRNKSNRSNTDDFIKKARLIHGNKYNYSKVEYEGAKTKVCIICPEHGEFWQTPNDHLCGKGCKKCTESKLEKKVKNILFENNITFLQEKTFDWLKINKAHQYLDFYIPECNIAIECQGEQHFKPVDFGNKNKEKEEFDRVKLRDKNKFMLCKKHNINIIYINFDDNIEIIQEKIKKLYDTGNNEPVNDEC